MTLSIVPPLRPIRKDVNVQDLANQVHAWMEHDQVDFNLFTNGNNPHRLEAVEDAAYARGAVDAYINVLGRITKDDTNESKENVARRTQIDNTMTFAFNAANKQWVVTPEYNYLFLRAVEAHLNARLARKGWLLVNEVLDELSMRGTAEGAITGWTVAKKGVVKFDYDHERLLGGGVIDDILIKLEHQGVMYQEIDNAI